MRKKKFAYRSRAGNILLFILLFLIGCFMTLPLVYSIVNAFKPMEEFFVFPPKFYVVNPTTENFVDLFSLTSNLWVPFSRYIFNSLFVSITATFGNLLLAVNAAYVLAKHTFRGKSIVWGIIIVAIMFSTKIMMIPQYLIYSKIGIIDTHWVIILPALGMTIGVFLLKQFMENVPNAILESARIDGAGEFRICWKIVVPAVKPAMITLLIFVFQAVWTNTGSNLLYSEELKVLPTILMQIGTSGMARAGTTAAASLLLLIPPVVFFVIAQSQIIETMTNSGIKE